MHHSRQSSTALRTKQGTLSVGAGDQYLPHVVAAVNAVIVGQYYQSTHCGSTQASPSAPPHVAVQMVGNIDQVTDLRALCCSVSAADTGPSHVAVATNSASVHVFEVATRGCVASLTGHTGAVLALDVRGGQEEEPMLLVTGSKDNGVRLWTVPEVGCELRMCSAAVCMHV